MLRPVTHRQHVTFDFSELGAHLLPCCVDHLIECLLSVACVLEAAPCLHLFDCSGDHPLKIVVGELGGWLLSFVFVSGDWYGGHVKFAFYLWDGGFRHRRCPLPRAPSSLCVG